MATTIGYSLRHDGTTTNPNLVVGYALGGVTLLGAWLVAAAAPAALHPASLVLVLLGALALLLVSSSPGELAGWGTRPAVTDVNWIKQRLLELATIRRAGGGLRGLERELIGVADPLERQALLILSAGGGALEVETGLQRLAAEADARAQLPERLWRALGQGAVNAGVLVSTMTMFAALRGGSLEASNLAGCLSAALYGLCLGHAVCGPQALRSRRTADAARLARALWIEGFVAVAAGVHPRLLAERFGLEELLTATDALRIA